MVKEIDGIVKREKHYSSRNEFVRDALRKQIMEYRRDLVRAAAKQLGEKARNRGWDGRLLTREERDQIAEGIFQAMYPKKPKKVHAVHKRALALAMAGNP